MLQAIVNGLLVGSLYSIIGTGLSLSFSLLHVIDMAVGDWIMMGAYIGCFVSLFKLDPFVAIPGAFIIFIPVGYLIYRKFISRVLKNDFSGVLMTIVLTFGFSTVLRGSGLIFFGSTYRRAKSILLGRAIDLPIIGVRIPMVRLIVGLMGITILIGLFLFLKKTKIGNAIRAISQDMFAAKLMGIKTDKVLGLTYGISLTITAIAGIALSSFVAVYPEMGITYTLFAFFIVVLAGVGYLPGVIIGGIVLGMVESFTSYFFSDLYVHITVFSFLYLVLLISPSGIFRKGKI